MSNSAEMVLVMMKVLFYASYKASLYSTVIRTLIQEIRQEFINMGVDEQTLFDLQTVRYVDIICSHLYFLGMGTKAISCKSV